MTTQDPTVLSTTYTDFLPPDDNLILDLLNQQIQTVTHTLGTTDP